MVRFAADGPLAPKFFEQGSRQFVKTLVKLRFAKTIMRQCVHQIQMSAIHHILIPRAVTSVPKRLPISQRRWVLYLLDELRKNCASFLAQYRFTFNNRAQAITE